MQQKVSECYSPLANRSSLGWMSVGNDEKSLVAFQFHFPFYQHPLVVLLISKRNGQMRIKGETSQGRFLDI